MTLDYEGRLPVYVQLADILQARIEAGELAKGKMLPSESRLIQEFGTSRGTVRKAIEVLRERGLVDTVAQRGTFVI